MSRGYAAVGLVDPKTAANVGSAIRACHVFNASMIAISGVRYKGSATDTTKGWRHIPLLRCEDVLDALPFDCAPVAVDILPGAIPLPEFNHPPRAFYIFGAEDQTLGARVTSRCAYSVVIPSAYCLNLAAAVNVILYDRVAKEMIQKKDLAA